MRAIFNTIYIRIKNYWHLDLILFLAIYATLFNQLTTMPMYIWDEAVYADNSLQMIFNKNFLINYFDGTPDMWNMNPPLSTWIHIPFMLLFNYSELAMRLPSALSGVIICFFFISFFHKHFKNDLLGYFSSFVLLTTSGFVAFHVTRTGDLDAIVSLFSTLYVIFFYLYIEYESKKYLMLTFLFILCAYFTKSVAGLLFLPGLLFYAIYKRKLKMFLFSKHFLLYLSVFIFVIISYYITVDYMQTGFVKLFIERAITGRYFETNEGHSQPFFFYFTIMRNITFKHWIFLLPLSLLLLLFEKNKKMKDFLIYIVVSSFLFFVVISFSETKLAWYNAQIFPFLSIWVAYGIFNFISFISCSFDNTVWLKRVVIVLFIIAIFGSPFLSITNDIIDKRNDFSSEIKYGLTLNEMKIVLPSEKQVELLVAGFNPHTIYYKNLYNQIFKYNISIQNIVSSLSLEVGKTYMFFHPHLINYFNAYIYSVVYQKDEMLVIKIINKKL